MRCKGRVFRDTGQGAKIMVVLVGLALIFKEQITTLVQSIWTSINKDAKKVYS